MLISETESVAPAAALHVSVLLWRLPVSTGGSSPPLTETHRQPEQCCVSRLHFRWRWRSTGGTRRSCPASETPTSTGRRVSTWTSSCRRWMLKHPDVVSEDVVFCALITWILRCLPAGLRGDVCRLHALRRRRYSHPQEEVSGRKQTVSALLMIFLLSLWSLFVFRLSGGVCVS